MERAPRGRPRAEPRQQQQARILDAARRAFTDVGYEGATLSAIARDAGVARPAVYELVGGKEDLLAAVADELADELIAAVDARFSEAREVDRHLDELVLDEFRWFVDLMVAQPLYATIISQGNRLAHAGDNPVARARGRIEDRLAELHAARTRAIGLERPAVARVLSAMVLAMLETVAVRVGDDGWPADAVATLVAEFAAGGYRRTEAVGASEAFERDPTVTRPTSEP